MKQLRDATLCFPLMDGKILLGKKKERFGKGKYNGFGGHVEAGESIEDAVIRELKEESGLLANLADIKKYAELDFYFPNAKSKDWEQRVHVYLVYDFKGKPKETDEMTSEWISLEHIPYDEMWDSDKYWLPLVLRGKNIKAKFTFSENNETIKTKEIVEC